MSFLSESYKKRIQELAGIKNEQIYYNSHGVPMPFEEFIEEEVYNRKNYSINEINNWVKKYKIKNDDFVIWVTPNKKIAQKYMISSYLWDDLMDASSDSEIENILRIELDDEESIDPYVFKDSDGIIIPESDDGESGFLMILNKEKINESIVFTPEDLTKAYDKSWQRIVGFDINMIKQAIREGRAIGVSYKSKEMPVTKFRVVLPVTLGTYRTKSGVPLKLSAFHLAGQSERAAQRAQKIGKKNYRSEDVENVWRLFDLDRKSFKGMWFSDKFFYEYPPGYKKGDKRFVSIMSEYDVNTAEIERDAREDRGEKVGEPIDISKVVPTGPVPAESPENIEKPEEKTIEPKQQKPLTEKERRLMYLKKPWNKFLRDGFKF